MIDASIFERHLDVGRLRAHRRGLVLCPFHRDVTASLSIDLDRGLFHCFSCGEGGGVRRFAQLVGELRASLPATAESPLAAARAQIVRDARAQRWAEAGTLDNYFIADWLRSRFHLAEKCRLDCPDSERC